MRFVIALLLTCSPLMADTSDLVNKIRSVDHFGKGNEAALKAVQELSKSDPDALVPILESMNGANPIALNWLQGAFESVAGNALDNKALPADILEKFTLDRTQNARARRLAYDWLLRVDPQAEERLLPSMLDDPAYELRRDAVDRVIKEAKNAAEGAALPLWQQALAGAVDEDHVKDISKAMEKLGGDPVNLVDHFGYLTDWYLIGPFDNREEKGFDVVYPPEKEIDLGATYDGMKGKVAWQKFESEEKDGKFDIRKLTEHHKGAIDYAYTEFESAVDQEVEVRLELKNAWKLWVNGELLFEREEYHRGQRFDQYQVPATLKAGTNTILLKVCQNEQDQSWAQEWEFKLRICDPSGRAIHPADSQKSAAR